jgi:hypothetical protein
MALSKEFKQKAFPMAAVTVMSAIAPVIGSMTAHEENPDAFKALLTEFLTDLGKYLAHDAIQDSEFAYLMSQVGEVLDAQA